ncbi:MAG: hypothetical protein HKO83_15680 [Ignavibacteriaceae bacterium]|nr:hypothetical protein [Ignavibacteria bacterium]NNL22759.1 hypothetical protein [Ignavibacteriaceae bacterium]
MKKSLILFFLTLIFITFLVSCTDEPSSLGVELISGDLVVIKTFDSQIDSVAQSSSYFKNVISLGSSSWILLGKYQDTEASVLLKFIFGLSDSLRTDVIDNNISVLDSWIVLRNRYTYGDTLASMEFTTHKVNSDWSFTQFTIDSLSKLQYETENIGSNLTSTDTNYTFNIDESLALSWMKNSADNTLESNYGIYLKPTDMSGKISGFEAFTALSSEAAKLYVVIEKSGVYTDTINGFIIGDVSLVDGDVPAFPVGLIGIQSGVAVYSKLNFDVSGLPKGLVVNSAELILAQDSVNSVFGTGFNNSLRAGFLQYVDSLNTQGNAITLAFNNNTFTGNITAFLRNWIDTGDNNGLLIQPGNQFDGLELFAIYGSDASNFLLRPRLKVTYTIKENL